MAEPLEILVDTDVQVPTDGAPKKIVEALKRQLRQHDLPRLLAHDDSQRPLLSLMRTSAGHHRLPQGLLQRVTQTCQRHNVPYAVVDRRAMVSCPPLRTRQQLDERQNAALRRLLLHDSGVLIAPEADDRAAVVAEVVARRQQRALLLVQSAEQGRWWLKSFGATLGVEAGREVALVGRAQSPDAIAREKRIVVAPYSSAMRGMARAFGMVIFDAIDAVDPIALMRAVRGADARYLLGLAAEPAREDALGEPLFLVLGGVVHKLAPHRAAQQRPRLSCRREVTRFTYPAYEGRAQYQALMAALAADERRNQQITTDIVREAATGQCSLVISERRDHLEALASMLPDNLPLAQVTSAIRPIDRRAQVACFEGGELSVLLCTSQIALELIRTPRLSRLFVTFPFSYARRLERLVECMLQPSPEKSSAVVYDYDDVEIAPLHRAFNKRATVLERLRRDAEREYVDWAQLRLDV